MKRCRVLLCLLLILNVGAASVADSPIPAIQDTETAAQRDARLAWWRDARFGMFIHWGVYAQRIPEGVGEWVMHNAKIPVAHYKSLAGSFNPSHFDADSWVELAKDAGMKYIVITTKHHDGFAMFPSKADPFNIMDATPFKRDPIRELCVACHKQGMRLGFYYSQDQDWTAPGGAAYGGDWDPAQNGSFAAYLDTKAIPQIEELLTNYQPYPDIVWFDFPTSDMTPDLASKIVKVLNKHPNLIWNNRLGGGYLGDTITPEQHIPPQGYPGKDWETCMTISPNWAYRWNDHTFKPTPTLLHNLVDIASKGGNYLLNVGPDDTGVIPQPEADRLHEIGAWLKQNGTSIYETSSSPLLYLPDNERMTVKGNTLFLHVFDWSTGPATLPGLDTRIASAVTLVNSEKLTVGTNSSGETTISVPSKPDSLDTVVVLKLAGPLKVTNVVPPIKAQPDGYFNLGADVAMLSDGLRIQGDPSDIGYWTKPNLVASWKLQASSSTYYSLTLVYSCFHGCDGSTFDIVGSGGSKLSGTVSDTGDWTKYTTVTLPGALHLDSGIQMLTVKPTSIPHGALMNLQSITLRPITP